MKIAFLGDLGISGIFKDKINEKKIIVDNKIIQKLNSYNLVHINCETPITNRDFRSDKKGAKLKAPLNTIDYLKKLNIGICDIANNHIMDCGIDGAIDTIKNLKNKNIISYGTNLNAKDYCIYDIEGLKIALIAFAHKEGPMASSSKNGPYKLKIKEIKKKINYLRNNLKVDYIFLNYHGGTEFNLIPEPKRYKIFSKLSKFDINVIIGHHAHVPQGWEFKNDTFIFYGIGNFTFDLEYHKTKALTDYSYYIEVEINNKELKINRVYYHINKKDGIVEIIDNEKIKNKINSYIHIHNYKRQWFEEAHRVYRNNSAISLISNEMSQDIKIELKKTNNFFKKYFMRFKLICNDLVKANKRPFLIAEIKYQIRKRVFK